MPFIRIPGVKGQLYVPESIPGSQSKHKCQDCTYCQWCNDDKCTACLKQSTKGKAQDREGDQTE